MPERPASAASQNFSTPIPMGETIPRPVMTGWCFIDWLPPVRLGRLSTENPSVYVNR
jgi:hypothetical protein